MARKPTNFITIKNGKVLTLGGLVMERAGYPKYLYGEWAGDRVTLYREEDYEMKRQGIYKVGWGGGGSKVGKGQARISSKPLIEGAGLVDGRYVPISVDEDKIVFSTTPYQIPEQHSHHNATTEDDEA
jgi:hypothetical protein